VHICATRGEARGRRLHASAVAAHAARVITSIHTEAGCDLVLHGVALDG
jgi:hypothetical protein